MFKIDSNQEEWAEYARESLPDMFPYHIQSPGDEKVDFNIRSDLWLQRFIRHFPKAQSMQFALLLKMLELTIESRSGPLQPRSANQILSTIFPSLDYKQEVVKVFTEFVLRVIHRRLTEYYTGYVHLPWKEEDAHQLFAITNCLEMNRAATKKRMYRMTMRILNLPKQRIPLDDWD